MSSPDPTPAVDLVPGVDSRIVTVDVTEITEGYPLGPEHWFDFALSDSLDDTSGGMIIAQTHRKLHLVNGKTEIRLPTYDADARTPDGTRDWSILVTSSFGYCKKIRVPAGSGSISLGRLQNIEPLTGLELQYAITSVSVSVSTGFPPSGTGSYSGGELSLDFTLPMGNDFVKGTLANGTDWNTVTEPGMYLVSGSNTYTNTPPIYSPGKAGVLMVWGSTGGNWGGQDYIQHGGFQGERAWRTSRTVGTWNAWQRPVSDWGLIPEGTDVDTLRYPGFYRVSGLGHAGTISNLPPRATSGTFQVLETGQSSGNIQTQMFFGYGRDGSWIRTVANTSGVWQPWVPLGWDRGTLPGYTDLNDVRIPGVYRISPAGAGTLANSPITDNAATLTVTETGQLSGLMQTQILHGVGSRRGMWERHVLATDGSWSEWVDLLEATEGYWAQHSSRVSEFTRRRGGVLGTGGVGAVAFRWDHNWDHFATKVAPLVEQYGIVSSMAVPGMEFNPAYVGSYSPNGSFSAMEKWSLSHGMEIMSHSYSHGDAQNINDLDMEIRFSRDYLETQMRNIKVDVWAHPGVATEGDDVAYMGLGTGVMDLHASRAGRMLMGNYAVTGGHADGYFRELNGTIDQSLSHYTIETEATASNVIGMIDQAASSGTGLVLMLHPNRVGTAGYISASVLGQIFAHVAQLRDEGRIVNTTVGGMSLADSSSTRRRNIAENSFFVNGLDRWAGAGWTVADGRAISPADSTPLSQGRYWSRRAALAGSWHELVVDVASTGGAASVTVRAWDDRNAALVDQSRVVALPTDGSFKQVRVPFGIPYMAGANTPVIHPSWSVARTSGARVTVRSIRVEAI